ncbi:hypothetical protein K8R43_04000 [archaeon]|nr:hypothetical protein [archaeon]
MLLELFLTLFYTCSEYGKLSCWAITSFLTSIIVFIVVAITSYYFKKIKKEFNWLLRLVLLEIYLFLAWIFVFITSGVTPQAFQVPLLYGLAIFFLAVTPATLAYQKLLKKYPMLPWHLLQFLLCLIASAAFWGTIFFVFGLFSNMPLQY